MEAPGKATLGGLTALVVSGGLKGLKCVLGALLKDWRWL